MLLLFEIYITEMDRRNPYTLSVLPPTREGEDELRVVIQGRLREFILAFQLDNSFIYRLIENLCTNTRKCAC